MDTTKRPLAGLSRLLCLLLLLALCLSAAGCGRKKGAADDAQPSAAAETTPTAVPTVAIAGREIAVDATDITAVLSEGETEKPNSAAAVMATLTAVTRPAPKRPVSRSDSRLDTMVPTEITVEITPA